jgi:hypothetical protein
MIAPNRKLYGEATTFRFRQPAASSLGTSSMLFQLRHLGRKCTMIEREERYCEIAAKRMSQEVLPL